MIGDVTGKIDVVVIGHTVRPVEVVCCNYFGHVCESFGRFGSKSGRGVPVVGVAIVLVPLFTSRVIDDDIPQGDDRDNQATSHGVARNPYRGFGTFW